MAESMAGLKRSCRCAEVTEANVGQEMTLMGWVQKSRNKGGIIFTDRETVDKVEKMKVCTCLNPLHTTLAIYGCLLGYTLISEEMKNPLLKKFVEKFL